MSASAPSNGEDSTLAIKCMDFCHALASQGMAFSFSLSVGSGFSFSLDAREKKKATSVATEEVKKKKLSPSKVRRNAKRRQEFLKRKSETSDKGNLGSPAVVGGIPCAPALPCASRRLVTKLRRRANTWTFSQLDGAPPSPSFHQQPCSDGDCEEEDHCKICNRCFELCQVTVVSAVENLNSQRRSNEQPNVMVFSLQSSSVVFFNARCAVLG